MAIIKLSIHNSKNRAVITYSDLIKNYLIGIPLVDQKGNSFSESSVNYLIEVATQQLEGYLNLKLRKQVIEESLSYNLNDYKAWGYIPTSFPIIKVLSFEGFIGTVSQIIFPVDWLRSKKTTDGTGFHRSAFIVPNTGSATSNSVVYSGLTPQLGWFGQPNIPHYWTIKYCTSFIEVPQDIIDVLSKYVTINILNVLGDTAGGVLPGLTGSSLSIDGLSQNLSTLRSSQGGAYSGRIKQYTDELTKSLTMLKNKYDTINISSL